MAGQPVTTLAHLRRFAVARSLFPPTTLEQAFERLGFVQADPIRAPARAQDLTLRHRVHHYRAGDLERRYAQLPLEEDVFINYGFVTRGLHGLMHPRIEAAEWNRSQRRRVDAILEFVRSRGTVHPREVDAYFAHGTVTNYWGGVSKATTHLLEAMHYFGLLRVVRREAGTRVYGLQEVRPVQFVHEHIATSVDALVDVVVRKYAPLPGRSLSMIIARLRYAAPQWQGELKAALTRARQRLARASVIGVDWYWPSDENPGSLVPADRAFLLAPFDPIVWDRLRFELFWDWPYRFEAYTPARKRLRGYYALPLLWRDRTIGWGNLMVHDGRLQPEFGFIRGAPPSDRRFRRALDDELEKIGRFLGLDGTSSRSGKDR
jgi:uncharacterized protein